MTDKPIPESVRAQMAEWGKKGGKRRLETMTPEQRSKIAKRAGKASGRSRKAARQAR